MLSSQLGFVHLNSTSIDFYKWKATRKQLAGKAAQNTNLA